VGTGSATPQETDTQLTNEVESRGTVIAGLPPNELNNETDTTDGVWRLSALTQRVVQMTAPRNLTEFGLSRHELPASGPLHIRELFRDEFGDPATVSLIANKYIRLDHTMIGELPIPSDFIVGTMDVQEYDAANALVFDETFDTYWTPASGATDAARWLLEWWEPTSTLGTAGGLGTLVPSFDPFVNYSLATYRIGVRLTVLTSRIRRTCLARTSGFAGQRSG
jgi:hypothetical protein